MKSLNIAIILGPFPTVSETFIVNQITALIDKGHNVKIYSSRKRKEDKVHKNVQAYNLLENVVYKEKPPVGKLKRVYGFLRLIFIHFSQLNWDLLFQSLDFSKYGKKALNLEVFYERKFFILNKKFDVVHVHFATQAVNIAKYKSQGFLKQAKLVVSFHGFDINPSKIEFYQSFYKQLFIETDHFTVNTIYTKEILLKANPSLTNVTILPESLDTVLFKRKEKKNQATEKFTIVYCGRLVPFKGSLLLPLIVKELINRGHNRIILKIIGGGELEKQLQNEIEKLDLTREIELVGVLTQDEIISIFNEANVFLLPGVYEPDGRAENQGLVIQEAQAMELPVVVSDVGGMKYGLLPDITGFVVAENDINGFADSLETLIKDPRKAEEMGKQGRKYVEDNYNSKDIVDKLVTLFKE